MPRVSPVSRRRLILILLLVVVIALALWRLLAPRSDNVVVVYVSHDEVFSEPILKDFERDTRITVKAVYDAEETKSAGVMNRLIAEQNHPQADVYWANDPIRAEVLRQRGVTAPYRSPSADGIPDQFRDPRGYWTGFSGEKRHGRRQADPGRVRKAARQSTAILGGI